MSRAELKKVRCACRGYLSVSEPEAVVLENDVALMIEVESTSSDVAVGRFELAARGTPKVGQELAKVMARGRAIAVDVGEMHSSSAVTGCLGESEPHPTKEALNVLCATFVEARAAKVPAVLIGASDIWRDVLQCVRLDAWLLGPFNEMTPAFRDRILTYLAIILREQIAAVDAAVAKANSVDRELEERFARRYNMPSAEVRARLGQFADSGEFDRLSRSFVGQHQPSLRFWQERMLERFRVSFPRAPTETADISFALSARCGLHEFIMRDYWRHGRTRPLHHWELLRHADKSLFPFAEGTPVCPRCVGAEMKWIADHAPELCAINSATQ